MPVFMRRLRGRRVGGILREADGAGKGRGLTAILSEADNDGVRNESMPLFDHFHKPPFPLRWESFHGMWAATLTVDLNKRLPKNYSASPFVRFGIEIDVAALERFRDEGTNGPAWTPSWTAPPATATIPFAVATDEIEVLVHEDYPGDYRLVGAIEFVSPANKDRPETRDAFLAKCDAYLQKGIGVVVVDVVTSRLANLHDELLARHSSPEDHDAWDVPLYAVAYKPVGKNGVGELSYWRYELTLGEPLPTLPFWLYGGIQVPVELESTYTQVCRDLRIPSQPAPTPAPVA
jgi:hypothetical protein